MLFLSRCDSLSTGPPVSILVPCGALEPAGELPSLGQVFTTD